MKQNNLLTTMLLLFALIVGSTSAWALEKTLVYSVTSKTAVTLQNTSTGSFSGTVTFANSGTNNNDQMTSGNTMTLTLANFPYKVTKVSLNLHRNSQKGSGTVGIKHNDVTIGSGTKAQGDLTSSYENYDFSCTDNQTEGNLVVLLTSTANSFWCNLFTITYEEPGGSTPSIKIEDVAALDYNDENGDIVYSISNYAEGSMQASTTADWISDFDYDYDAVSNYGVVGFVTTENTAAAVRTATVTLTYTYGDNETATEEVTVTQAGDPNAKGGVNDPYTVAEARAASGSDLNGVYVKGIVTASTMTYNASGWISYYISDDGTKTAGELQVYQGKGINGANFTSANDIQVEDEVVVCGNLTTIDMMPALGANNQLTSLSRPEVSADNVGIAYDATNGSIAYIITDGVASGTLSASVPSGSWVTLGDITSSSVPFTCEANPAATARTETVTLTYTYGNNNKTQTKEVTITQAAAPYSTIAALFADATATATDVVVTFDNWVVSGVSTNGKNVFVTDNSGHGFVINYSTDQSSTYSVGKILSGTSVSCSLKLQNGYAQITNLNASDLTISDGGTVNTSNIALANLAGVNTGVLVHYDNLTCSVSSNKYYLSDGATSVQMYTSLFDYSTTFENGKTYNITGIYQQYGSTKEILPRSAADIEEVVENIPSISADDVNIEYSATNGSIAYTISNGVEGGSISAAVTDGDWLTLGNETASPISFTCDANTVTSARTATVTLTYTYDTNKTVSKYVTVTQAAAPAAPYSGTGYIRVNDLGYLSNGAKVIIAARYNSTATSYYAMTAATTGKPTGVSFTSTSTAIGEALPAAIIDDEDDYYWTVGVTTENNKKYYTFTNANGNVLGYTSSTNFATGGNNTEWTIERATADESAMVGEYEGFYIVNKNNTGRAIALNNSHNYGPYAVSNNNSSDYNFYLDIFVDGAVAIVPCNVSDDSGYRTFASNYITDWSDNTDGIAAYKAVVNGDDVSFVEVTGKVPANTGLLIKADAAGDYNIPTAASADEITSALIGVTEQTTINNSGIYVLYKGNNGVGFYKTTAASFTLGANTAYLPADVVTARSFIALDEEATGISEIETMRNAGNEKFYNLKGQQVAQPTKGLYIVGGRKVVMK